MSRVKYLDLLSQDIRKQKVEKIKRKGHIVNICLM